MDKMTTLLCPSCGAQLEVIPNTRKVTCPYCGSTHALLDLKHIQAPGQNINSDEVQKDLMLFFGFGMSDLEYNRKGVLSPYQKKQFSAKSLDSFLTTLTVSLASILFIYIWLHSQQAFLCWGIVVIVSLVVGFIKYKKDMKPAESGIVQCETGVLHKTNTQNFSVGHIPFPTDDKRYKFLEPGVLYKVYYSPIGNVILSIELANP